ncbi:FKBP-type peptidyl-prolyl cis-trans isomerase [Bacteriovoracaceae bacterium]|nr:FKBP-type peptidyl-prolyl cis-trans isomerase [Bacteriovoracaceae bacterium]
MDQGLLLIIIAIGVSLMLAFFVIRELFLKKSKSRPLANVRILKTEVPKEGVQVDILKEGTGAGVNAGSKVRVHYTAWLVSGVKVDSSHDRGELFDFTVGRNEVIPGWEAGMIGMKSGEIRKFTISPENAYGSKGKANVPPNSIIIFEVELINLK